MTNDFPTYLPAALGLAAGVLVWAILCARARSKR